MHDVIPHRSGMKSPSENKNKTSACMKSDNAKHTPVEFEFITHLMQLSGESRAGFPSRYEMT